jgi:hypothetical protein
MDWKSVEEFVGEDEGRFGGIYQVLLLTRLQDLWKGISTVGHKAYVLTPDDR